MRFFRFILLPLALLTAHAAKPPVKSDCAQHLAGKKGKKTAKSALAPKFLELNRFSIPSPRSEVFELEHKKSGARIVYVKNSDPARTLVVNFKTPPTDDTGVFHILEHIVLQGSRLYPSARNFNQISNSSLSSTMNASTYPEKTRYYYTTKDANDFNNLLLYYMDAVFFPKAVESPRLFQREGWRYEVDPDSKQLSFNGVVLNEMKGAVRHIGSSVFHGINRAMIPDTPYNHKSGGFPDKIPDLDFAQLVATHQKYYRPQNSLIYLYGDIDYQQTLITLDKMFLSHYDKADKFQRPEVSLQEDFNYPSSIFDAHYPGEKRPGTDILAKGYVLGPMNRTQRLAMDVILEALKIEDIAKEVPIKSIAKQLNEYDSGENIVFFTFQGTDSSQLKTIDELLARRLDKIAKDGFKSSTIESIVNRIEFINKEMLTNRAYRGQTLGNMITGHWMNSLETSLQESLDFQTIFKDLRRMLKQKDLVREMLETSFLKNDRFRWTVLRADPKFFDKIEDNLQAKLDRAASEKSIDFYQKETQGFQKWMQAKSSYKGKVPVLDIADIKVDEKPFAFHRSNIGKMEVLEYPRETQGVSYLKLYFDLKGVEQADLKNLQLLSYLIKHTKTTGSSADKMEQKLKTFLGAFSFQILSIPSLEDPNIFKPMLQVNLSFLNQNRKESFAILKELLTESEFAPLDKMEYHLNEYQEGEANDLVNRMLRIVRLAIKTAQKDFIPNSQQRGFVDGAMGVSFENYIRSKIDPQSLSTQLKDMLPKIFHQDRLHLSSIMAEPTELAALKADVKDLSQSLFNQKLHSQPWSFKNPKNYDGFTIAGNVQYSIEMVPLLGEKFHGAMKVYANYLNTNFLIPQLREKGGAYGAGASFDRTSKSFNLHTYRDPNLKSSYDTFSKITNFMAKQKFDKESLKPSILGALKEYYSDMSLVDNMARSTETLFKRF